MIDRIIDLIITTAKVFFTGAILTFLVFLGLSQEIGLYFLTLLISAVILSAMWGNKDND